MCQEVFAEQPWFLLGHGTIVIAATHDVSADGILKAMRRLDELIGPHGGEGSPLGDCTPMRLNAFDGWLVGFTLPLHTFVGDDEIVEAEQLPASSTEVMQRDADDDAHRGMQELRIGLFGRHKRNKDAGDPKIIACHRDR